MNDLHWALLGVGGALVAGVWAHGKWQESRQRKLAQNLLNPEAGDPLMERKANPKAAKPAKNAAKNAEAAAPLDRREPVIGVGDGSATADGSEPPAAAPAIAGKKGEKPARPLRVSPSAAGGAAAQPTREPEVELLGSEADYIARYALAEAVSGEQLLAMPRDAFAALRKRVAWIAYETKAARWQAIEAEGRYTALRIGVQLADRTGPINVPALEQFRRAAERVGDDLTAVPEFPPTREAAARAAKLDKLCAEVDIQVAIHIAPRHDHFSPDTVRELAIERGFRLSSDGALGYHDAGGERLFTLQMPDARAPDGLPAPTAICLLEVPCVTRGEPAFDKMMAVAQELADALDGLLVDEHRRPITDRFVGPVRAQIGQLQDRMASEGVASGSALALRLFS